MENPRKTPKLGGADLYRANLYRANLSRADLGAANLSQANLSLANLSAANLCLANLSLAQLSGADLGEANLSGADLRGADLSGAQLSLAHLWKADLRGADLSGADLSEARLPEANLSGANLRGVALRDADLSGVDLSRANLGGVDLTGTRMINCKLDGSDLTGSRVYGASVWDASLTGATQRDLIITPPDQPDITVDNLEVAQFVYLLLNNARIREVIDTITSKAVLILGRFTPERKRTLDALRDALRAKNYLPIVFDFEKPAHRDFTETVSTLAHLARFVIADLTDPRSIPQELTAIVPRLLSVPIRPLLLGSQQEWGMFSDLARHRQVIEPFHYTDDAMLLSCMDSDVIGPAERKAQELAGK
jgi:uncharacterized protein YjbI with pentapeptide repeats